LQYLNWGVEERKKVMYSDENHFWLRFANSRWLCRRPCVSDRFDPRFIKKSVKHLPKIMAWDSFSWKGRAALDFLDKGEMMNSARYLTIVDEKLELFMRQDQTTHFLQDGTPCHS
jgi:hypothetical protein